MHIGTVYIESFFRQEIIEVESESLEETEMDLVITPSQWLQLAENSSKGHLDLLSCARG